MEFRQVIETVGQLVDFAGVAVMVTLKWPAAGRVTVSMALQVRVAAATVQPMVPLVPPRLWRLGAA